MKGRSAKHPHHTPLKKRVSAASRTKGMPSSGEPMPQATVHGIPRVPRLDKSARKMKSGGEVKGWIKGAIKHPGAMTAAAEREGVSNSEYEQEHKHDSGKAGQRARLALTLKKMHK